MMATARYWTIAGEAMNNKNLIPGGYKFTKEDQLKSARTRSVNAAMRKMAKKIRGMAWTDADDVTLMNQFGIPITEQSLGMMVVLRTAILAAQGDKDARRDFLRMTGDDPDVAIKEEELKLKKAQLEQKSGDVTDIEDLRPLARLLNEPDTDD